jgi:modulator of FtsH protease HflC
VRKHIGVIIVAATIVAILILYMVAFTVRFQEQALVLTFNKISRIEDSPGLKWKWIPPIQKKVIFDTRIRTLQHRAAEFQTRDRQTMIVTVYVNWRITDVRTFYERFRPGGSTTASEDVIAEAEKAIRGWIADASNIFAEYDFADLVTLDDSKFKLAVLEKGGPDQVGGMLKRIQEKAAAGGGYGVGILDLGISKLGVPDEVTKAVFSRMQVERQSVVRTLIAEGEREATTIRADAVREATILKAQAQADAKDIRGKGDAAAAKYYQAFVEHKELANFLRRLETLRITLSERTTFILDSESPPYELITTGTDLLEDEK